MHYNVRLRCLLHVYITEALWPVIGWRGDARTFYSIASSALAHFTLSLKDSCAHCFTDSIEHSLNATSYHYRN